MRNIILLTTLLLFFGKGNAQTSETEAKAAYLLAEEAFTANDWKVAIFYLEESKKKIGAPNCKILYLQLMSELELAKTDTAYYTAALKTIAAFEKAPDVKRFDEEKVMEVMKAKLRTVRLQETMLKERIAMEERKNWMKTLGGIVVYEKEGHGLVMAHEDIGQMNLSDAKKACENLSLNGHNDWRLPTREEFSQMVALGQKLILEKPPTAGFVAMKGMYWISGADNKKIASKKYAVRPVRAF